ncbi:hypothetical protein AAEX28_02105 [Lentisphaerota bacterium WC36G]|nr:hypothetical protein LJT99_04990 [Lentisphaerae bacterium WC36]
MGVETNGSDGGTFVEYKTILSTPNLEPKYTIFETNDIAMKFAQEWFINIKNAKTEKIKLVMATSKLFNPNFVSYGMAHASSKIAFIFNDSLPQSYNSQYHMETTVHELGHLCWLLTGIYNHVDNYIYIKSHCNNDSCVMSYTRDRTDKYSEFCIDCLYSVRKSLLN